MEQSIESSGKTSLNQAVRAGLILGIIHIVIFLLLYMVAPGKLTGLSYVFVILCLNIGYGIYHNIGLRKESGGYLSFGAGFKFSFVILAINGALGILFSVIFLIIDPGFPELMAESQLNTSLYWAGALGAPEDVLEKMQDEFKSEDVIKRFSFSGLLSSFGLGLVFYAIGALIIALITKKQQPETF